jgi:hypothetical protein
MKKFDFVLDFEASSSFPANVEVSYSWEKPDYRYPQYVHRSGAVISQITDEGHFIFLVNRLFGARGTAARDSSKFDRNEFCRPRAATYDPLDRVSPLLSPTVRASPDGGPLYHSYTENSDIIDEIKTEFDSFCGDADRLEKFYAEVSQARPFSTKDSPAMPSPLDSPIPTLELPASLVARNVPQSHSIEAQQPASINALIYRESKGSPSGAAVGSPH